MSEENRNNTAVEHEYGADQIQILEGLDAVRPMYTALQAAKIIFI